MKWACIIILIIDLMLVGFASFRYMTVPKSEVEEKKLILNNSVMVIGDMPPAEIESNEDGSPKNKVVIESPSDWTTDQTDDDFDYKNIDMSEDEEIWEYDDQYIKEERMGRAREQMNAVFGPK